MKQMKKYFPIILLFLGCDKPEKETFMPPKMAIKVIEWKTKLPIVNAKVGLYESDWFNSYFHFIGFTDNNGTCKVPIDLITNPRINMDVTKAQYWKFNAMKVESLVSLQPEGWIQMHIQKTTFYPSDSKIFITISSTTENLADHSQFNPAADSLIMVRGFGNTINKIEWQVISEYLGVMKSGVINGLELPKFDTLTGITVHY